MNNYDTLIHGNECYTLATPSATIRIISDPLDSEASVPRIYLYINGSGFENTQDCVEDVGFPILQAARAAKHRIDATIQEDESYEGTSIIIRAKNGKVLISIDDEVATLTRHEARALGEAYYGLAGHAYMLGNCPEREASDPAALGTEF